MSEEAGESVVSAVGPRRAEADGTDVLTWLFSEEAAAFARSRLARARLGSDPALVEDVISDARVAVLRRMQSETPLAPENPAAYGTRVVANVVNRLVRGDTVQLETVDHHEAPAVVPIDDGVLDDVRMLLERCDVPAWLTSASLAYVCFTSAPDALPKSAPAPAAGSRPDHAMGWPALWFAGERDLFPRNGVDDKRRTRARRIEAVKHHLREMHAQLCSDRERHDA
jgi:hypothetical protein